MEQSKKTIEAYIKGFPVEIQERLNEMYYIIKEVTPEEVTEKISWGMPTFYLKGNLVHFAGFNNHTGFYPGASGIESFKSQFVNLKFSKGAVQFAHKNPLPKALIQEIVRFRVKENTR
jgi:uncharacterized protein YdhG (YjbR/CyaY superfamily)